MLAPFKLVTTAPFKVNSAPLSNFSYIVGSPKSLSPMKLSSKCKTEESTSKIFQKFTYLLSQSSSPDVIDLSMLPSSPPVVDLKPHVPPSSSTPLHIFKSEPNLIDLCTPEVKLPKPSPISLQLSSHIKSDTINLCSPDYKPVVQSKPSFVPPQLHSCIKVKAIDLRSPDHKPIIHSVNTAPGLVHVGDIFNS